MNELSRLTRWPPEPPKGWRVVSNRELYIKGNRVLLTTKSGTLAVAE